MCNYVRRAGNFYVQCSHSHSHSQRLPKQTKPISIWVNKREPMTQSASKADHDTTGDRHGNGALCQRLGTPETPAMPLEQAARSGQLLRRSVTRAPGPTTDHAARDAPPHYYKLLDMPQTFAKYKHYFDLNTNYLQIKTIIIIILLLHNSV